MAHLLVSWLAYSNDFIRTVKGGFQSVDLEGPTAQFHEYLFTQGSYDEHIILYSEERQELLATHLVTSLRRQYPGRSIRTELLPLTDIIDLVEIKTKIETWLLEHAQHVLTLYFSPGTSIMQLAWYICHTTLGLNTHLVQTRAGRFSPDKKPVLLQLEVEQSAIPMTAIIREKQVADRTPTEALDNLASLRLNSTQATSTEKDKNPLATNFLLLPSIAQVYRRAEQVAQTDKVTVLVRGESGTGKEHLAQTVHQKSNRQAAPFLAFNCAALTDSILESRLFGYKKGAFSGADKDTKGVFELAQGGTVFLDEIGDISPAVQSALLRVLQSGEIQPLGGIPRRIDVRVVAATHADLEERCRQGHFRWDLYYRLAVAELELPALRERPVAEREQLLNFFILQKQVTLRRPSSLQLSASTRQQLLAYSFPGNVRELENLIETLYVFQEPGKAVFPSDLPRRLQISSSTGVGSLRMADVTRQHIVRVVSRNQEAGSPLAGFR
jgi:transcriptional regulator with GAF, ATPase, and Fis domain